MIACTSSTMGYLVLDNVWSFVAIFCALMLMIAIPLVVGVLVLMGSKR